MNFDKFLYYIDQLKEYEDSMDKLSDLGIDLYDGFVGSMDSDIVYLLISAINPKLEEKAMGSASESIFQAVFQRHNEEELRSLYLEILEGTI